MSFSVDNIIQQNSGSFEALSGPVSLPSGTTAGSCVVIVASVGNATNTNLGMIERSGTFWHTGPLQTDGASTRNKTTIWTKRNIAASETSWTLDVYVGGVNASAPVAWAVFELSNVNADLLFTRYVLGTDSITDGSSLVTSKQTDSAPAPTYGVTQTEFFQALGIAAFGATSATTTPPAITGYDTGYSEVVQQSITGTTNGVTLGVAFNQILDIGSFTAAATMDSSYVTCDLALLCPDDAKFVPEYVTICGFEYGTPTNMTVGPLATTGMAPWDAVAGSPEIVSTFARSGSYSLKLSATSAIENATKTRHTGVLDAIDRDENKLVERFHFYFDTSLPGNDVELYSAEVGSLSNGMKITYRTASQKIGVTVGSGTEVLSDATVAANKWIGVDFRYRSGTTHTCEWQVDYDSLDASIGPVAQTTVTQTGMSGGYISPVRVGWSTATTATVYYDDIVTGSMSGQYPIGDVRIMPVTVDQTDTPTITGTSTNFKTFTSNGTLATWSGTTARALLDDVPPTIGASADGITQIAAASGDYVTVPMATYTAAPLYSVRAARWYVAGWAASTTTATCHLYGYDNDGVQRAFMWSGATPADPNWDDTTLRWWSQMHYQAPVTTNYRLSQANVNGLALRFGMSTDATPDIGIHSVLVEVAVQPAQVIGISSVEADAFKAYVRQDPVTQAPVSYAVATPSGTRGATLTVTVDGVDQVLYVGPNDLQDLSVGAEHVSQVTSIIFAPDPG
jgi:hypothetical protein